LDPGGNGGGEKKTLRERDWGDTVRTRGKGEPLRTKKIKVTDTNFRLLAIGVWARNLVGTNSNPENKRARTEERGKKRWAEPGRGRKRTALLAKGLVRPTGS